MEQDVPELTDFGGDLIDLFNIVVDLISKHGGGAKIRFDAGANNVQAFLEAAPSTNGMR